MYHTPCMTLRTCIIYCNTVVPILITFTLNKLEELLLTFITCVSLSFPPEMYVCICEAKIMEFIEILYYGSYCLVKALIINQQKVSNIVLHLCVLWQLVMQKC